MRRRHDDQALSSSPRVFALAIPRLSNARASHAETMRTQTEACIRRSLSTSRRRCRTGERRRPRTAQGTTAVASASSTVGTTPDGRHLQWSPAGSFSLDLGCETCFWAASDDRLVSGPAAASLGGAAVRSRSPASVAIGGGLVVSGSCADAAATAAPRSSRSLPPSPTRFAVRFSAAELLQRPENGDDRVVTSLLRGDGLRAAVLGPGK